MRWNILLQITFFCICLLVIVSAQAQQASTDSAVTPEQSAEDLNSEGLDKEVVIFGAICQLQVWEMCYSVETTSLFCSIAC